MRDIQEHPDVWPPITDSVRHRLLDQFPYSLVYLVDRNRLVLIAAAHSHRVPNYWIDRI
jgi:hypothetical protein